MTSTPRGDWRPVRRALYLCLASTAFLTGRASAQEEITVTGDRPRGAVQGAIGAELSMDENAVRAAAASTLADLLAQLSAQLGGSQGRAGEGNVVLLNGRRITSLKEVSKLPPEAVARVDILPEEAALRYGYSAHQKVVNVVLRPRFASITSELEDRVTQATARNDFNTENNIVRIAGENRVTLDVQYQVGDDLTEADRGIVGRAPSEAALRSLVPLTRQFTANGVYARALGGGVGFTANLNVDRLTARDWLRPMLSDPTLPLTRATRTDTGHAGGLLTGTLAGWNWSLTTNADHVAAVIRTAADGPAAARESRSIDDLVATEAVANGTILTAPAGDVGLSVKAGASGERLVATDENAARRRLSRRMLDAQLALEIPVLSKRSPIGAVTAGASFAPHDYSDAKAPADRGWSLNWSPRPVFGLLVAGSREALPATIRQLGDPLTTKPAVRFYDFGTGESLFANQITGGDPLLRHDVRSVFKVEATVKPAKSLSLLATYTDMKTRDPILAFPGVSPAMEALLPGRIQRDAGGRIIAVDARPFNAAMEKRRDLRFGFNFTKNWVPQAELKVPGNGSIGGGNQNFGASGTMVQFALYDDWRLDDSIQMVAGQAPVDLFRDNTLGDGLRASRHTLDAQLSATRGGVGMRVNAAWRSSERVASGSPGGLTFDEPVTMGIRLFYFPAENARLRQAMPWLQGVRFLLAFDNLFGSAPDVRDRLGQTPFAYQRGYLDPLGRAFRFSIRKTL